MDNELATQQYSYGAFELDVEGWVEEGDVVTYLWLSMLCGHQFRVTSSAVDSMIASSSSR